MALVELLQQSSDGDFLRAVALAALQILMEADVEGLIGAGRHERSAERLNYRSGYREPTLDTRLGSDDQARTPASGRPTDIYPLRSEDDRTRRTAWPSGADNRVAAADRPLRRVTSPTRGADIGLIAAVPASVTIRSIGISKG